MYLSTGTQRGLFAGARIGVLGHVVMKRVFTSAQYAAGEPQSALPKVLIHRFSTDSIRARQIRLGNPRVSLCNELMGLYRSEGFFRPL